MSLSDHDCFVFHVQFSGDAMFEGNKKSKVSWLFRPAQEQRWTCFPPRIPVQSGLQLFKGIERVVSMSLKHVTATVDVTLKHANNDGEKLVLYLFRLVFLKATSVFRVGPSLGLHLFQDIIPRPDPQIVLCWSCYFSHTFGVQYPKFGFTFWEDTRSDFCVYQPVHKISILQR